MTGGSIRRFFIFLIAMSLTAACSATPHMKRFHPDGRVAERYEFVSADGRDVRHGLYRRWHPNGTLAEEARYVHGRKTGPYFLWYENGNRKLVCAFQDDRLDGPCGAWFENGKKRLAIEFDQGKKTGEWVRFGEKAGVVARVSFQNDRLNGPLSVLVNRGTGSGRGTSYEVRAGFDNGRPVGPFLFKSTDDVGNSVAAVGRVRKSGVAEWTRGKNFRQDRSGRISVLQGGKTTRFENLERFMAFQVDTRIMPMFTLDFCDIRIGSSVRPVAD